MAHVASRTLIAGIISSVFFAQAALAKDIQAPFKFYEHSGVTDELRKMRAPELGAAHAISLSSELLTDYSADEISDIQQYGPWLSEDGISHNAQVIIRAIQDARVHGLNPETYQLSVILNTVDTLAHLDAKPATNETDLSERYTLSRNTLRLRLNNLLDTNFITLTNHLGQGVVDGRALQKRLYRDAPKVNAFNLLVSVSDAQMSVREALERVTPTHPNYKRLVSKMRDLLTEKSTGIARTKVNQSQQVQPVASAEDKQLIRERLLETGDLSFEAYMATDADSTLLNALNAFQLRHGLEPSKEANDKTRAALNASVDDDINAVAINLERWRWLPRDFGTTHIYVNIPDYQIDLVVDKKTTLSMPVVVGKILHQTPSFSRDMSYMEFNPTWTVPVSIATKELIPKERRRPGYLVSRQFDFLKRVNNRLIKVPPSTVTAEDLAAARFPYTLRQRGGPINALGRMKFMMPNQYAIYLHDTQAKKHFTLNDRAYSHGCIRLSDPDSLARHLMANDGYSTEKIESSLASKKTHRIRFREPIPTHLVYLTSWVDENNVLQHRPDIYKNDDSLLQALKEANTLISQS